MLNLESTAFILVEAAFADYSLFLEPVLFCYCSFFKVGVCVLWILPFVYLCNVNLLSVCLWLARRWEGVLLCTSCADWKGVSIVLCILLVLMVAGLFVFESVSVSWSCLVVPGALVQLDAGWKGVFTAEAKWESRPPPRQPPQPLIRHTTTLRLIFNPFKSLYLYLYFKSTSV